MKPNMHPISNRMYREIVIQPAAEFDRFDDVRSCRLRSSLRLASTSVSVLPIATPMSPLQRRRVADDDTGHATICPCAGARPPGDLVPGGDAGDHADIAIASSPPRRSSRRTRPADDLAVDAELAGDRGSGHRVIAGDHPDLDPGRFRLRDRCPGTGPRRVDDPDQASSSRSVTSASNSARDRSRRVEVLRAAAMTRGPRARPQVRPGTAAECRQRTDRCLSARWRAARADRAPFTKRD